MDDESMENKLKELENEGDKLEGLILRILEDIHNNRSLISQEQLKEKEIIINANLTMVLINSSKQEKIRMKLWSEKQAKKNRFWYFAFLITGALLGAVFSTVFPLLLYSLLA